MTLDPYASCPCGSGKKFKWCCQPIYAAIQHAWEQENNEQHEAALRTIDQVVKENEGNPEVWGQKANLLLANGRAEEAEEALERAFAINPNYPNGLRLRARLRHAEGEMAGALLLARRAVDVYDPQAHDALSDLYALIFDCEMRFNRPVAARAALEIAVRLAPAEENLRQGLEGLFGEQGRLPLSARKSYKLRSGKTPPGEASRLSEVARVYEALTAQDDKDAAAWFNLAVGRAWVGDNPAALQALDRYLDLETDTARAVEAAALGEVLRCGAGAEDQCDYREYAFLFRITNPQPVQQLLQEWANANRLIVIPTEQEGMFTAMLLETTTSGLVTAGRPAADAGRFAGYLLVLGDVFRFSTTVKEAFGRIKEEVRARLSLPLGEMQDRVSPPAFHEINSEALLFPSRASNDDEAMARVLEHAGRFFEETWTKRPRKSLNNLTPADAASSPRLQRRLLGVIQFMQECAQDGILSRYNFDNLRRKLGLPGWADGAAPAAAPAAAAASAHGDVAAMNAEQLSALPEAELSHEDLEKAYQAAYRLNAQEAAARFAEALVARPPVEGKGDRYPWYSFLIQKALREGAGDAGLDHVNAGEQFDCTHNEGRRRNDYELWRAQAHVKRGDVDQAQVTYQRLIERIPGDFKVRGKAAEAMLSLKQPAKALQFAEEGLGAARKANDRDNEQYMQELVSAAKKQGG